MVTGSGGEVSARQLEWAEFASEFEFEKAAELAAPLEQQFSLGEGRIGNVHALKRAGQPLLVAFDQYRQRRGPTGSVTNLRTFVAVRGVNRQAAPPMRASARRGKALEALEASRSGAQRLSVDADPEFEANVSVFTRERRGAAAVLTRPVREVLLRLLIAADESILTANGTESGFATTVAPSLVVGQRDLLLCLEPRRALPVGALGALLADMLSLHVAFEDAGRRLTDALLD